jgi:putative addiction module antidote
MVKDTVLQPFGNSTGATIPKPMLERLHVGAGDRIYMVEVEGGILMTPYDPNFRELMAGLEFGMSRYRNAMRELANK